VSRDAFHRLAKFSLVGAIGVAVQLGVLAGLLAIRFPYLSATAFAVECAVVHNFLWHQRFTWGDRNRFGVRDFLTALLRFHLSNGLISLFGNLLVMRILSGSLRLPFVQANLEAISLCFVANFLASDRWVFRQRSSVAHDLECGRNSILPTREALRDPASGLGCAAQMADR
jgi:putative flippase GtrA